VVTGYSSPARAVWTPNQVASSFYESFRTTCCQPSPLVPADLIRITLLPKSPPHHHRPSHASSPPVAAFIKHGRMGL